MYVSSIEVENENKQEHLTLMLPSTNMSQANTRHMSGFAFGQSEETV